MFCKSVIKNPKCFVPYSMTIFGGRPSYLVHLRPFGCLEAQRNAAHMGSIFCA
jgi:hypothetical protein